jgi:tRNA modification GTPase
VKHWPEETIAAIATPVGVGGIGVIRVSGPGSLDVVLKVFTPDRSKTKLETHRVYHGWVSSHGRGIDEALLCYMAGPNSYTGEDVAEISCHGGKLVVRKVLELVIEAGARLAEKGEFTKRAFLNGRIDLIKAEAVADLIGARSDRALAAAAAQLGGVVSGRIGEMREALLSILTGIEAAIDFPEDVETPGQDKLAQEIAELVMEIDRLLATADEGRMLRGGVRLVIVGKPNVGKSSLLNKLIEDERVIVSDLPGTTRDTIEENLVIEGLPFIVIDTAGIRSPKDGIEAAGIGRTLAEIGRADVALVVLDASNNLSTEDEMVIAKAAAGQMVIALNKIDLGMKVNLKGQFGGAAQYFISALRGDGLEELKTGLINIVMKNSIVGAAGGAVVNTRHKECLWRARGALEKVLATLRNDFPVDLLSIDLRSAMIALGEITGQDVAGEIIEKIFQQFCVGK